MSGSKRAPWSSGPALPFTFDRLQADHLAFCLAVAPGEFDGVADGADVTAQDPREPDDRREPGADGILDPSV
ncbi:hypothetical protein A8M32_03350 [Sinorhizobium alkalisoli]|uniref:Uncharacterized protein n=1 Tax=Sinorhizobium alkalisoli TaxID=1752398 RepID=A0A1E3VGK1_9HYPH|nr:hypothetical protein A8M32_03350 [Sinorhizobium alkalisoli]